MSLSSYSENGLRIQGHRFEPKKFFKPKKCSSCNKYIAIGTKALICRFCGIIIHTKCQNAPLLPCSLTPQSDDLHRAPGTIEAFVPSKPPFVPSLVVRCIGEVELRGMEKKDLYQTEADSREAESLLEDLLKNEKATNLRQVDIDVIASTLKLFLSNLSEPLLPRNLQDDFVRITEYLTSNVPIILIDGMLRKLPRANNDTLTFLIIHLQRVANYPEGKIVELQLARQFGPLLVDKNIYWKNQIAIVDRLLRMPYNYWTRRMNYKKLVLSSMPPESVIKPTGPRVLSANSTPSRLRRRMDAVKALFGVAG